jgi:hypothetical protein
LAFVSPAAAGRARVVVALVVRNPSASLVDIRTLLPGLESATLR